MLEKVKLALRISTDVYDNELMRLTDAARADLGIAGITNHQTDHPLIEQAVITYCRTHFGSPADYDRLKAAYDEQKAQLQTATGFTDWGDG